MRRRAVLTGFAAAAGLAACGRSGATGGGKAAHVVIGIQNGVAYIPLHVMQAKGLVEKHAKALGVAVTAEIKNLGQAAFVRDALLADQIQFGVRSEEHTSELQSH